ncbi:hypothetical protein ABZ694_27415 [Streptomyces albidoflavus]|uniref:hypothetical protein n=1 Tax=Streptomyces albidoflavus TaxID=1886 RepID=UPI0033D1A633
MTALTADPKAIAAIAADQPPYEEPADRHLLALIRALLATEKAGGEARAAMPLGGTFDLVVTSDGMAAARALRAMDEVQGVTAGVVRLPAPGLLLWCVPPGTAAGWAGHPAALCVGAPYAVPLPGPGADSGPGPYWARPFAAAQRVPPGPLRALLTEYGPPPPHDRVAASGLITISPS